MFRPDNDADRIVAMIGAIVVLLCATSAIALWRDGVAQDEYRSALRDREAARKRGRVTDLERKPVGQAAVSADGASGNGHRPA